MQRYDSLQCCGDAGLLDSGMLGSSTALPFATLLSGGASAQAPPHVFFGDTCVYHMFIVGLIQEGTVVYS